MKPAPHSRSDYARFQSVPTRWNDADRYGHVNNAVYYAYFDTVVNRWLIDSGLLDLSAPERIGLVVETGCNYFAPIDYPSTIEAGLRVGHVGTTSVRYEIGLFASEDAACAQGHFVHVYVDPNTREPTPIPAAMRNALQDLRTGN